MFVPYHSPQAAHMRGAIDRSFACYSGADFSVLRGNVQQDAMKLVVNDRTADEILNRVCVRIFCNETIELTVRQQKALAMRCARAVRKLHKSCYARGA